MKLESDEMNSPAEPTKKGLSVMNTVILVLGFVSLFTDLFSNIIVPILQVQAVILIAFFCYVAGVYMDAFQYE